MEKLIYMVRICFTLKKKKKLTNLFLKRFYHFVLQTVFESFCDSMPYRHLVMVSAIFFKNINSIFPEIGLDMTHDNVDPLDHEKHDSDF